jgi:hypothetical protein
MTRGCQPNLGNWLAKNNADEAFAIPCASSRPRLAKLHESGTFVDFHGGGADLFAAGS